PANGGAGAADACSVLAGAAKCAGRADRYSEQGSADRLRRSHSESTGVLHAVKITSLRRWMFGWERYTSWQWQPTTDTHDPNPPLTLEAVAAGGGVGAPDTR